MELILLIIILAFLFEAMDSAAGMGFGTCLSPLLLVLGYGPLQVIPAILISETISGFIDSFFGHKFKNVQFSFRPLNDATKIALLVSCFGCLAIFSSITISYLTIQFLHAFFIKIYVVILVFLMGIIGLLRFKLGKTNNLKYNPKVLIAFSALAGFNKGIGGGGYGPVITLGQIYTGVYEKSATSIVSLAEAIVSLTGIFTFCLISIANVYIDLILLPSIFTGGFFAALFAPYWVRVFPNKFWRYFIPIYACILGTILLFQLF
ncbi:MAG: TSUP family transporter [Promethearchaeota archaeon]